MDVREGLQTKLPYVQLYFCSVMLHDRLPEITENLMYLNVLGQPMVIINNLKVASELLDRRANIYSDRPRRIVANEIFCGGLFTPAMPHGDLFVFTLPRKHQNLQLYF